MKTCTICKEIKPLSEFYSRKDRKIGFQSQCIICERKKGRERWHRDKHKSIKQRKNQRLISNYGLTTEQWNEKLNNQKEICPMCNTKIMGRPQTDHNHTTGQIRDILCQPCNLSVGHYELKKEQIETYLKKWDKLNKENLIYFD